MRVRRWGRPLPDRPFAVVDVETTGLSPTDDRVIEIAVVTTDHRGRVTDEWSTLVDPGRDAGPTDVHGITDDDLAGVGAFGERAPELSQRVRGCVLVAHNLSFDAAFLAAEQGRAPGGPAVLEGVDAGLCTLELSRRLLARPTDGWSLGALCASFDIPLVDAHRALVDARATAGLLEVLLGELPSGAPPLLARRLTARR